MLFKKEAELLGIFMLASSLIPLTTGVINRNISDDTPGLHTIEEEAAAGNIRNLFAAHSAFAFLMTPLASFTMCLTPWLLKQMNVGDLSDSDQSTLLQAFGIACLQMPFNTLLDNYLLLLYQTRNTNTASCFVIALEIISFAWTLIAKYSGAGLASIPLAALASTITDCLCVFALEKYAPPIVGKSKRTYSILDATTKASQSVYDKTKVLLKTGSSTWGYSLISNIVTLIVNTKYSSVAAQGALAIIGNGCGNLVGVGLDIASPYLAEDSDNSSSKIKKIIFATMIPSLIFSLIATLGARQIGNTMGGDGSDPTDNAFYALGFFCMMLQQSLYEISIDRNKMNIPAIIGIFSSLLTLIACPLLATAFEDNPVQKNRIGNYANAIGSGVGVIAQVGYTYANRAVFFNRDSESESEPFHSLESAA